MVIAVGFTLWNLWQRLGGKQRWLALALALLTLTTIATTENRISHRIAATFASDSPDRFSDYPDDRLAFWHAHWLMVTERPWLGHGINLNTAYRTPYYEKLNLSDFPRKYSAHNQWLQLLADGGMIGLLFFCAWAAGLLWQLRSRFLDPDFRAIVRQSLAILAIASLTQNAFYDSEVRYLLTLILCLLAAYASGADIKPTQPEVHENA